MVPFPPLPSRFTISLIDKLSSYLGTYNPIYRRYNPDTDALWLFDNTAFRSPDAPDRWTAEFVAAHFLKNSGQELGEVVANLGYRLGVKRDSVAEETMRERLKPFVGTILPARSVFVRVGGREDLVKLGPGGRNGISADLVELPGRFDRVGKHAITTVAAVGEGADVMAMTTYLAEPEGWAVISDIDDTIKVTLTTTSSSLGVLESTFVSNPTPIAGMPDLYQRIDRRLSPAWFYVSASPYNLYPFLRSFIHDTPFPRGPLILRDSSWMNVAGFLASITRGTYTYKTIRMRKIHSWLPRRRVICIGDSTQSDPEAYAAMYRLYGGEWIRHIFIRKVTDVSDAEDEEGRNGEGRFEKAFEGVPDDVWRVFEDPRELYRVIDGLAAA
ncbi:MAG: hypothetical protein M1838_002254 [Thelocarpon superellum]|nr:MAG: hypothetical protein M1838_002254 [Thelocarpon superellum]